MPAADPTVLLLAIGLTVLGAVVTGVAWRRGHRGRVVQGVGLTLAPAGLYLSGLLALLWDGALAVGGWAMRLVYTPTVWAGLSLLLVCLVLWVVGGVVARRAPARPRAVTRRSRSDSAREERTAVAPRTAPAAPARRTAEPVDDEMAEIEALLKKRGIE